MQPNLFMHFQPVNCPYITKFVLLLYHVRFSQLKHLYNCTCVANEEFGSRFKLILFFYVLISRSSYPAFREIERKFLISFPNCIEMCFHSL